jgi:hypothetical protein
VLTFDFGFPAWHLGASNNKLVKCMNRIAAVLFGCTAALLLVTIVMWLRPRVFDEELIFIPEQVSTDVSIGSIFDKSLYKMVFDTPQPNFNDAVLKEIQSSLDSRHLDDFNLALVCIEKGIEQRANIPKNMRDKRFLRSKLVLCLKTELYRIHYLIQKYPRAHFLPSTEPVGGKEISDYVADVIFWILKEFTFKKQATLNEFWKKIKAFENSEAKTILIKRRWTNYSFDNFYGEMVLNNAIPPVDTFMEKIEKISI